MLKKIQKSKSGSLSVITPTLCRASEVAGLLENLCRQSLLPEEVILIDGSEAQETATRDVVQEMSPRLPFRVIYFKHERGTAIQRNAGVEKATGEFIAFIDDDVRLEPDFLEVLVKVFTREENRRVGGIVGYRTNRHFDWQQAQRWRWYRRLGLLTTYEPGRYDFQTGYPINANMQPPFNGIREVDFMTTACAVWRKEVFASGLRFDPFFCDYGVLEDAHFSLRAGRDWRLLQCGDAHCQELHSPNGRVNRKKIGYKCVVNYYYVFKDIVGPLSLQQNLRFWRYQIFELLRIATSAIRRLRGSDITELQGRLAGFLAVARGSDY
jgi:glycosyltransferase involved in cell wall biosynthesis